ncbi:uncharacterized protein LY89DRAFT_667079 [Mollisia scopiformis]|uniref:Uncharacterized protein n=1 Tax=Mollisia scopiformis TaxID=149040 RepID=A0A194XFV1_MOLSC|nr:uncharacterized protein LY89DRAFT_667079 [Mollisia scopiformis]KUJ19075.1 hypothetical protein LY89DRAFT_667079 [Mollisia scopiformis]
MTAATTVLRKSRNHTTPNPIANFVKIPEEKVDISMFNKPGSQRHWRRRPKARKTKNLKSIVTQYSVASLAKCALGPSLSSRADQDIDINDEATRLRTRQDSSIASNTANLFSHRYTSVIVPARIIWAPSRQHHVNISCALSNRDGDYTVTLMWPCRTTIRRIQYLDNDKDEMNIPSSPASTIRADLFQHLTTPYHSPTSSHHVLAQPRHLALFSH